MNSVVQHSISKINIGLAILNKRADGYHAIDTIFQSIHLGDTIYFAKHHSVVFSGIAPELPPYMNDMIPYDESNLAMKALRAVQNYTGCTTGGAIHLLKRVPPAAGLGGSLEPARQCALSHGRSDPLHARYRRDAEARAAPLRRDDGARHDPAPAGRRQGRDEGLP